jgi:hypothetical protein
LAKRVVCPIRGLGQKSITKKVAGECSEKNEVSKRATREDAKKLMSGTSDGDAALECESIKKGDKRTQAGEESPRGEKILEPSDEHTYAHQDVFPPWSAICDGHVRGAADEGIIPLWV